VILRTEPYRSEKNHCFIDADSDLGQRPDGGEDPKGLMESPILLDSEGSTADKKKRIGTYTYRAFHLTRSMALEERSERLRGEGEQFLGLQNTKGDLCLNNHCVRGCLRLGDQYRGGEDRSAVRTLLSGISLRATLSENSREGKEEKAVRKEERGRSVGKKIRSGTLRGNSWGGEGNNHRGEPWGGGCE